MDESQGRFKVTREFNPAWGGGYDLTIEDTHNGNTTTSWCKDLADLETCVQGCIKRFPTIEPNSIPTVTYVDGVETPAEDAGEVSEVPESDAS